jgi:hypothetical protein
VSAQLAGQPQLRGGEIDGDDRRRAERAQELDPEVPEPADPDQHCRRARHEQRQRALDRVIGRERGVRQRRSVARVEAVERHQEARAGHEHELGHPAVPPKAAAEHARAPEALAQRLAPAAALAALAAAPVTADRDGVTRLPAIDAGSNPFDPAGVLVPERERQ